MIKHIVMWKLREHADGASKQENARTLKKKLEGLKDRIPEIARMEVGLNFNTSDAAYDVVLVSEFQDREALAAYQKHPQHLQLISYLDKIRLEKKVVDYEVSGG